MKTEALSIAKITTREVSIINHSTPTSTMPLQLEFNKNFKRQSTDFLEFLQPPFTWKVKKK